MPRRETGVQSIAVDRDTREALRSEGSLLLATFFLGTNPVAVKYAVQQIPPTPFVVLRFVLAGVLLLALLRFVYGGSAPKRRDLLAMAGVGFIGVSLNNLLFASGVSMTTASETALIYATPPLWGMMLAFLLGIERPGLRGVLGVVVALLGVVVIVYGGLGKSGSGFVGNLLVMGGAVCWGSYTVLALRLLQRHPPLAVAAYTMFFGGLAVLPLAIPEFMTMDWTSVRGAVWAALIYSTVFVAAFGFLGWQRGVSRLGANRVLVYQYLVTLIGVVTGVVLLAEGFGANKIVGGFTILLGVFLARRA